MQPAVDPALRQWLDSEARRVNTPEFIAADPVQFPRRFTRQQDIEAVALLSATVAWGNRKMICANCEKMLRLMNHDPYNYIMDEGYEELPDMNIHRTFFASDMRHYLRGLHAVFARHGSLGAFARAAHIELDEAPAWRLAAALNRELDAANGGVADGRCLPRNLDSTALKRLNMALRWLVRDDGIVDIGIWRDVLSPSQLFIPLDVHVADNARALGLLERRSNDRRAVEQLTAALRTIRPDDPVLYDFALFGLLPATPQGEACAK